jgi:hypothetical protein
MVHFMVLSAPRCASTWVANWLTSERVLCLHDPVLEHTPEALDTIATDRLFGVACTGLALLTSFVNAHPARKVVIHRDFRDINDSLLSLGLTRVIAKHWEAALHAIEAVHVNYHDLFQAVSAARIYEYLTDLPFDRARYEQLRLMHIEPLFDEVPVIPERAREFRRRIEAALA